jgi:hypothetical protein
VGHFLCVTAVGSVDFARVLESVKGYLGSHGVEPTAVADRTSPAVDVALFEPTDGWTTVSWPAYFNGHDTLAAQWLSRDLGTLVSGMSIYDSDTWLHEVHRDGERVDRFARDPVALAGKRAEIRGLRRQWAGDPTQVARAFGVDEELIAPYYVHVDEVDEWEFVGLWELLGITYPVSESESLAVWAALDLPDDWASRLPTGD